MLLLPSIHRSAPYNLSFTAASLRPELARVVAEAYLETGEWDAAKARVLASNALQARSTATAVRLERELRQRLATLTHDQIEILATSPAEDRAAIAWLATIKYNRLIFDFASEVLRDKLAVRDPLLRHSDYEEFVERRSVTHPELAELKPASKRKIRNVLLRMLREAGILAPGTDLGVIQRPVLSPTVLQVIQADEPRHLAGFLVPDQEIGTA